MPFSFPSSNPTVGQTSTQNGRQYVYAGSNVWELVAASGSGADSLLRSLFVPPAPTGVTAVAGNAQAIVSWTAPSVLAQTPITDYVVQYSSNSGTSWTTFSDGTSTATSATVTGLTNGTAYQFRVAGVNAVGQGAWSAASSAVTPVSGDPYWANVQLLLPGDSSAGDVSSYSRSVTAAGNAGISTSLKRWGAGSLSFDGSGDYLTVDDAASLELGGNDFVVEMWLRTTQTTSFATLVGHVAGGFAAGSWSLMLNAAATGNVAVYASNYSSGSPMLVTADVSVVDGEWHHIAWARSGTQHSLYVDGVRRASQTSSISFTDISSPVSIGTDLVFSGRDFAGNIDDLRITVGNNRGYAGATITAPGSAFPTAGPSGQPTDGYFSSVSLLLHADGTGSTFVDSSPAPKTITATNATQSATQSKWGGKSASFGGNGYLSASGAAGVFGTGDFVVEAWVFLTSSAEQFVLDTREGANTSGMGFRIFSDNKLYFSGSANNALTTTAVPLNEWAHVAWVRSGGTMRGYINGVLGGTASDSSNLTATNLLVSRVGFVNAGQINGFMDDLRVTQGSDRGYTGATITVPTAAFPDS